MCEFGNKSERGLNFVVFVEQKMTGNPRAGAPAERERAGHRGWCVLREGREPTPRPSLLVEERERFSSWWDFGRSLHRMWDMIWGDPEAAVAEIVRKD